MLWIDRWSQAAQQRGRGGKLVKGWLCTRNTDSPETGLQRPQAPVEPGCRDGSCGFSHHLKEALALLCNLQVFEQGRLAQRCGCLFVAVLVEDLSGFWLYTREGRNHLSCRFNSQKRLVFNSTFCMQSF